MKFKRLMALAVLFSAVVPVVMGSADSAVVNRLDSMQYLRNVTVIGRKPYSEVIPAQTLRGEQLERLSSNSVADAMRYFAGVQIKDYGGVGGIKTIDVRSMGSHHMGVFYDGIQLGNAQNGQIDLGKFSLDNIEEISLYNGQKSEIFQPARDFGSAGTVYLRTKVPVFKAGKRDNVNVTFRTGSFGLANPSVRWEHKWSNDVKSAVNVEYISATGKYKFRYHKIFSDGTLAWDTTATRQNGDISSLRIEGAVFGFIPDGRWQAKVYYYDSEKGIPGAIVNNVWKNSQRQWDRNFFTQGSWQRRLTDRFEMMVNAKYARDFLHYVNPDTTLMYINNKFWQDEAYVSSANKYSITPDWDVNLSVDYKWNYLSSTLVNFAYPTRHTVLGALATAYTWRGLKAQASVLYTHVSDRYSVRSGDVVLSHNKSLYDKWTPAVFVSYSHPRLQALNVRAFYKRIFRMPTFNDLYYTDIGNASLRPEFATQWNAGVQYEKYYSGSTVAGIRLSADAYYNEVDDKIIAVPKGNSQYRWMMMNIGKVKVRGIDVTAKLALRLPWEVNIDGGVTYTYQKAQDYTDPTDTDRGGTYKGQISYIPWHSGSATLHVGRRDIDLNYSFIYVGERYHNSSNIRENYEQPWYTHDLTGSYSFPVGKVRIKATLEVNNLLNQQYDVIHNYPMPGRNYKLIIKFDI